MIILDINIPKSCKDCSLCTGDDYGYEFCVVTGEYDEIRRPFNCPINAKVSVVKSIWDCEGEEE